MRRGITRGWFGEGNVAEEGGDLGVSLPYKGRFWAREAESRVCFGVIRQKICNFVVDLFPRGERAGITKRAQKANGKIAGDNGTD